jgi:hypothetical protein
MLLSSLMIYFPKFFLFSEAMSVHSNASKNTMSPSFQLEIDSLLEEFIERDREEEGKQVNGSFHGKCSQSVT